MSLSRTEKTQRTLGVSFIAAGLALLLVTASGCRLSANFHTVEGGKLFRSAQLTRGEFEKAIKAKGLKTIVNLRGEAHGRDWYDDEVSVTDQYGVKLISISMSSTEIPTRENLIKLLDAFRFENYPMLIHCKAGADRTGEAAAIYQMEYMGKSKEQAMKMLSPKYHHLKVFTPAKDYFVELYQGEDWARLAYDPCADRYRYFDRDDYCGKPAVYNEAKDLN